MEYKPRYVQPFTLAEAVLLDVATITEEIARLQNSLRHLRQTQDLLRNHIAESSPDVDVKITQAFEENEVVIGSQEERIGILQLALTDKGISTNHHYNIAAPISDISHVGTDVPAVDAVARIPEQEDENDGGVHL